MHEIEAEIYEQDGKVVVDSRLNFSLKQVMNANMWEYAGKDCRHRVIEQAEREMSHALESACLARVQAGIEKEIRLTLGNFTGHQQFTEGMRQALNIMRGVLSTSPTPSCVIREVKTVHKGSGVRDPSKSRAPYSYEFEDAIPPASPVKVGPYWYGN